MLNEINSELEERLDSAAIEEMMIRTEVQMPHQIIEEQQQIEAREWNGEWK